MKLAIEDLFEDVTCDAYEALYFDEGFNAAISEAFGLGRQLLRLDRTPGRIVRHVCFEPRRDPGSPADQAFGTSRASFVEELDYDTAARRGVWRTIPNLFTERVANAGTLELVAAGTGVRRIVRGEVRVSLFGFGRLVERMIVDEIEKSYERTTRFTVDWLAKNRTMVVR